MLTLKLSIRTGKTDDLSDFQGDMVVGARRTGLSQKLLIYWDSPRQTLYREWSKKEKLSSKQLFSGPKNLVDAIEQKTMARLL